MEQINNWSGMRIPRLEIWEGERNTSHNLAGESTTTCIIGVS